MSLTDVCCNILKRDSLALEKEQLIIRQSPTVTNNRPFMTDILKSSLRSDQWNQNYEHNNDHVCFAYQFTFSFL